MQFKKIVQDHSLKTVIFLVVFDYFEAKADLCSVIRNAVDSFLCETLVDNFQTICPLASGEDPDYTVPWKRAEHRP